MLKIEDLDINKIKPYKNNPRNNKEAVKYVQESIKEFGMKQPIVIDKNNEIVVGHTRYRACVNLGYKKVPCLKADDLTDEQIKAYRIIDNKTNEIASWNVNLLDEETENIFDIDMTKLGLDISDYWKENSKVEEKKEEKDEEKESHRETTIKQYNLEWYDPYMVDGKYNMPIIQKTDHIPDELIGFNYMLSSENKKAGLHCFLDDYQFERLWRDPLKYLDKIMEYNCILSPDFSLYMDMPFAMKVWNTYRSRLIGQIYQGFGIEVIPTISWAEKETFEFCFDGIEPGGVVAVSTIGVKQNEEAFEIWKDGMDEMIKRLKPKTILCYGGKVEYDYKDIKVKYYENKVIEKLKNK